MINSHYIPQLLLRHFCEDEKIQYYDVKKQLSESRNTRSVFSSKGYYPEGLEKELCRKIEVKFAGVLNNKILKDSHKVILSQEDIFILKKYLIITAFRVKDDDLEHNAWYRVLKRDGFITEENDNKDFWGGDFYKNLNKVLECEDIFEISKMGWEGENLNLFLFIKDIIYSYNVFVKTNHCKEDFIIPDRGWTSYSGPMSVKKLNAMFNMLEIRYDPYIDSLLHTSSPQDYMVFPLTKNMAIVAISPAFKICLPGMPYRIIYPDNAPTLSKCLGFGDVNTIAPPDNRFLRDGSKEYIYKIQQLSKRDVVFLNSLLIKNANQYFGFAKKERIISSLIEVGLS